MSAVAKESDQWVAAQLLFSLPCFKLLMSYSLESDIRELVAYYKYHEFVEVRSLTAAVALKRVEVCSYFA